MVPTQQVGTLDLLGLQDVPELPMTRTKVLGVIVVLLAGAVVTAYLLMPAGPGRGEVRVLCGGSMRGAMEEIVRRYEKFSGDKVIVSYGRSGELCVDLQQTQTGDIYLCHDPFMPWVSDLGHIDMWTTVAYLDVVIVVAKGNPKGIEDVRDLAQPGLRLGISDRTYAESGEIAKQISYSTAGQMVEHMLSNVKEREAILRNVQPETKGHRQRCSDVITGALDAAFVWDAVAHEFADKLEVVPIREEYKQGLDSITSATCVESNLREVQVSIGITRCAKDKHRARRFYDFVVGRCRDVFAENGFLTVSPYPSTQPAGGSSRPSATSPGVGEKGPG